MSTKSRIIALISLTISLFVWLTVWALYLRDQSWAMGIAAFIWGVIWAACLQFTNWGRWLALHRTWLTVVIGVGMDLVILFFALPRAEWLIVFWVFALSSVGIILRSLVNEYMTDAA